MENEPFIGRVAIVTGGASGIGAATATRLAELGASVAIFDIDPANAEQVRDNCPGPGACWCYDVDISDQSALGAAIAAVIERFGQLNFLVNSAASFIAAGLEATESDWDRALSVNIKGYAGTVSKASRHMGEGSAIVNVASISAHIAQRNRWTYNATKAAIVEMTKCQALDLAPQGIRVNTVSPGWIWTAEVAKAANGDRARWEPVWGDYHILRRLGEPSEVASAITFLLSDAASFITASELMVDGGYSALSAEGLGTASLFASSR
jgi:NAD(P)-dependent dehydrogenase (short-subunit alcohol dehydrogenase family)